MELNNIQDIINKYPELKKVTDTVVTADIGNTFTKSNTGVTFSSRVSEVAKLSTKEIGVSNIEYKGVNYTVGNNNGKLNMDADKYISEHYKLCLLNAIAKSFKGQNKIKARVALGLPAEYFIDHSMNLKNEIKQMDRQNINIDGTNYEIDILDVMVFKQGGTLNIDAMDSFEYPMLILDFGGGTLDVSNWKYEKDEFGDKILGMTNAGSFAQHGFQKVMDDFVTKLNSSPGSDGKYNIKDAIEFLEDDELPFGEENTLSDIKNQIFKPYVEEVVSTISSQFKVNRCKEIRVIGGPSEVLLEYLKQEFKVEPKLIDSINPQCANAILFANRYKELLVKDFLENLEEIDEVAIDAGMSNE